LISERIQRCLICSVHYTKLRYYRTHYRAVIVGAYCAANPEKEEASYLIQRGVVPGDAYADTQAYAKALKAAQNMARN